MAALSLIHQNNEWRVKLNQKQLSEFIGTSERTLRRMSPTKRQQWASLAAKGRTMAWFDVLAQLMFEVEAFNASKYPLEQISLSLAGTGCATVGHYDEDVETINFIWVSNINQLTEALQYVQGLSK